MNSYRNPQLILSNGALFPFYLSASILSRSGNIQNEFTKQRILAMVSNNKKMYISEISDILEIPFLNVTNFVSELKSEGKLRTK